MSHVHDRMAGELAVAVEIWLRQMPPWPTWHADAIARPHGTGVNPHVYLIQRPATWTPTTRYAIADRVTVASVELWCHREGVSGERPPTISDGERVESVVDGSCVWLASIAPRKKCPCGAYRACVVVNGGNPPSDRISTPRALVCESRDLAGGRVKGREPSAH